MGVWLGLMGAIVLAGRGHSAAALFALSCVGLVVMDLVLIYMVELPLRAVVGDVGYWVMLALPAVAFLLFLYARAMNVRQSP